MSGNPLTVAPTDVETLRRLDVFVLDRVRIQAWDRILFVQCGDGWIVEEAWRRAMRGYMCGLDTSGGDIALAKQLREVPGKVEFATWDGESFPVPEGAFDRVVAILPQSHAAFGPLLRELSRVLREDGDLYLVHPTAAGPEVEQALASAGWMQVHELARCDGHMIVLLPAACRRTATRVGLGQNSV